MVSGSFSLETSKWISALREECALIYPKGGAVRGMRGVVDRMLVQWKPQMLLDLGASLSIAVRVEGTEWLEKLKGESDL